jgi:hypothetical protein
MNRGERYCEFPDSFILHRQCDIVTLTAETRRAQRFLLKVLLCALCVSVIRMKSDNVKKK